jgi:hypothetical protein
MSEGTARPVFVTTTDEAFEAVLPSARNPWGIFVALLGGVPWLVGLIVLSVILLVRVEPEFLGRALLGLFLVFILTILITVLAVASIWYAVFTVRGIERLYIDLGQVLVERKAMGIRVPAKSPRGYADKVVMLEPDPTRSNARHTLEVHAGRSRTRMGAGIAISDAEDIQSRAQAFLDRTREHALRDKAGLEVPEETAEDEIHDSEDEEQDTVPV